MNFGAQELQGDQLPESYYDFVKAMNDDLNTPKGLAIFHSWMRQVLEKIKTNSISNNEIRESWNFLKIFDSVFGLVSNKKLNIPPKVKKLID